MATEREKTNIIVNVPDWTEILEKVLEKSKEENPNRLEADMYGKIGYVEIGDDIYLLDEEGVGSNVPLTDEQPFQVGILFKYKGELPLWPEKSISITKTNIKQIPVKEQVDLSEFIRNFSNRLQSNFLSWSEFLKSKMS